MRRARGARGEGRRHGQSWPGSGRSRAKRDEKRDGAVNLRESQEWCRLIVNSVRDFAIFTADTEGHVSSWNPGAERFFGYRDREILGKPMELLYTPEDREAGVAEKERATAAEKGTSEDERWHVCKDGRRFFVLGRVNPMYTDDGELCGFIKIATDITERKELQKRLTSSEELHELILRNIPDFAILTTDAAGKIETWNTGAEKTYGYTASEMIGQSISMLYEAEERAKGAPERMLASAVENKHAVEEHWCVRKDGRRIFVAGTIRPLFDEKGNIRGFSKVGRDITARRQLEDQLKGSRSQLEELVAKRTASLTEAVHELETFSYSLSHDMRGPLRAMEGFAEVVLEKYGANVPEEGQDLLKRIVSSAQRLDLLIKESLAYYRTPREPLPLEPTAIEPLIETFCSEHPEIARGDALKIDRPLQKVLAHPPSLMQSLANLLDNAFRFVAPERRPEIRVWTERSNGKVKIYVEDNGIGIAPSDQQKIWNLFARLHPQEFEGTGIGLALVRKAMERMGGNVGVKSEEGRGSKFWLELPAAKDK